jgi:hypothetical protein
MHKLSISCAAALMLLTACQPKEMPQIDPKTNCRADVPLAAHTIILVDGTDAFTPDQAATLQDTIFTYQKALPLYGKFTVLRVNAADAFVPVVVVSRCAPASGKDTSILTGNPEMDALKWKKTFDRPIKQEVSKLLTASTATTSPVMEAIAAISWRTDFSANVKQRKLVLVSDLLQHDEAGFSAYRMTGHAEAFKTSALAAKLASVTLSGAPVQIQLLHRPSVIEMQSPSFISFWHDWLKSHGATLEFARPDAGLPADGK